MYQIEISHEGLHKYRKIIGKEKYVVEQKAVMQKLQWDEQWNIKLKKIKDMEVKQKSLNEKEQKKKLAEELTFLAQNILNSIENTLKFTLDIDDKIDWEGLKDKSKFPTKKTKIPDVTYTPNKPLETDAKYAPRLNLLEKLVSNMKQKKLDASKKIYEEDLLTWTNEVQIIENQNKVSRLEYEEALKLWEQQKIEFEVLQRHNNDLIDVFKQTYFACDKEAIIEYCDMVLANSIYPDSFPQQFELEYNDLNKNLVIEYQLPTIEDIPRLKEVKYIQNRDEFKETNITEAYLNKLYDSLIYQILLRTIHEIFEADVINAIDSVVLNGWIHTVDKGTGNDSTICVASVQTSKDIFNDINLSNVDPKACFKKLKGVASPKLFSMTPIAPILQISREDKRFVSSYSVTGNIDDSVNLAAMDWQDFEHLIRELFEKEFNSSGGEVKITQASKDGGVDAVAFDPDPIRGGKIVIQAKRYTNVVGLSSVRDLYGTVLNEGANKGILVTTADYGPDAYEFVKDKPLTLMNGNNLLYLLEKHGHKAKIDLKEAKLKM